MPPAPPGKGRGQHRPMLPAASLAAREPWKSGQTEGRFTVRSWGDREDHCMGNAAAARSGMAQRSSNEDGLKQLKASLLRSAPGELVWVAPAASS